MYLFTHFKGNESIVNDEQIYFSISKDGKSWYALNKGEPILKSKLGEKGVRDPHILRTLDNKFVIIATDLNMYSRLSFPKAWEECQRQGSKSVMIWKSDDLCNWSEQKMVEIATLDAGCVWAPETAYDKNNDSYIVFWASKTAADSYTKQKIYSCRTKDFETFTKAELYIEKEFDVIDTTIIEEEGVYYRFTKNEIAKNIIMEKSTSIEGEFEEIEDFSLLSLIGYEGPTAYKGEDGKWYLLLDHFSGGNGYEQFVADDIVSGNFVKGVKLESDIKLRHGTVMKITEEEYERLINYF
jgi:Glycosyl hydrolases family 43.